MYLKACQFYQKKYGVQTKQMLVGIYLKNTSRKL